MHRLQCGSTSVIGKAFAMCCLIRTDPTNKNNTHIDMLTPITHQMVCVCSHWSCQFPHAPYYQIIPAVTVRIKCSDEFHLMPPAACPHASDLAPRQRAPHLRSSCTSLLSRLHSRLRCCEWHRFSSACSHAILRVCGKQAAQEISTFNTDLLTHGDNVLQVCGRPLRE